MINQVLLVGHLGQDPEAVEARSGGVFAKFSMATSRKWRDKESGERKEKTTWHNVTVFGEKTAEAALQYLRKGSKVYVEGELATDRVETDQGNRYYTYVAVQGFAGSIVFLDRRDGDEGGDARSGASSGGYKSKDRSKGGMASGGGYDRTGRSSDNRSGGKRQAAADEYASVDNLPDW